MSYRGRGRGGFGYNNNNNSRNFNNSGYNNSVNQGFGGGNGVEVEILGWNGASPEECFSFIARKCRITVTNPSVDPATGILVGTVKSDKDANDLLTWSGVKFAGQSLKIKRVANQFGASATTPVGPTVGAGNSDTIQTITQFLKSRYQPETKMLNLLNVQADPGLVSTGFFASLSTSSKFFPALMKVAADLKLDVTSVDLSGNNLTDLTSISSLAHTFPLLKNLSLMNNKFARLKAFDLWKHKLNHLRELILTGNPLFNTNDQMTNKLELLKCFPRLIVLNGEIMRNEEILNNVLNFPFNPPNSMFFQDDDVQNVSTNFVANYYKFWDSNRRELLMLYQNESQFSMQVDSAHPHTAEVPNTTNRPISPAYNSGPDFSYYLPQSRNLMRVSAVKSRQSRVATGPEQIYKLFSQLPNTRHEIMTKPELFSLESYRFAPLNGIMIVLHGSFEELSAPENTEAVNQGPRNRYGNNQRNKKVPLSPKSFDRTFIIVPNPNGGMVIASDLLSVRPLASADAWTSTRPVVAPASVAATPSPAPGTSPAPGPQPTTADLPPDVKANLNIQQQEILVKIVLQTKLNLQYGVMLCQQSNWDYQQAVVNFKNSVGSLPPDAYV